MKLFYLWIAIGMILRPAIALSGGIGCVEISASVTGNLDDQEKEIKKDKNRYRAA